MDTFQEIPAGQFKNKCLKLLDEVALTGHGLVVTKRGKPIAKLIPYEDPKPLKGSILYQGDVMSPIEEEWEVMK